MSKVIKDVIHANGIDIEIYTTDFQTEYISITDIARYKSDDPTAVIQNWMRGRDVIEFLGLWETLHNSNFKPLEFEGFKNKAGANAFTMWYCLEKQRNNGEMQIQMGREIFVIMLRFISCWY